MFLYFMSVLAFVGNTKADRLVAAQRSLPGSCIKSYQHDAVTDEQRPLHNIPSEARSLYCSSSLMIRSLSFSFCILYSWPLVLKNFFSGRPLFLCQSFNSSMVSLSSTICLSAKTTLLASSHFGLLAGSACWITDELHFSPPFSFCFRHYITTKISVALTSQDLHIKFPLAEPSIRKENPLPCAQ